MATAIDIGAARSYFVSIFLEISLTRARQNVISTFIETRRVMMRARSVVEALSALAQEHRLAVFRQLVQAGDRGMAAGELADALGIPNSSLSFHLAQLRNAALILQERRHRSLIYRANYPAMNSLLAYLTENCCAGAGCDARANCEIPNQERKSA